MKLNVVNQRKYSACYDVLFMWAEVTRWSTVKVCSMLHSIGLSQYEENFIKKKVDGKELLTMQKQDFIVSMVCRNPLVNLIMKVFLYGLFISLNSTFFKL